MENTKFVKFRNACKPFNWKFVEKNQMERKFLVTRNLQTCCYLGVIHHEVVLFLGNSWKLCSICHYLNQKILQVDSWWDLDVQQLSYKIPRVLVYPLHETQGGPKTDVSWQAALWVLFRPRLITYQWSEEFVKPLSWASRSNSRSLLKKVMTRMTGRKRSIRPGRVHGWLPVSVVK